MYVCSWRWPCDLETSSLAGSALASNKPNIYYFEWRNIIDHQDILKDLTRHVVNRSGRVDNHSSWGSGQQRTIHVILSKGLLFALTLPRARALQVTPLRLAFAAVLVVAAPLLPCLAASFTLNVPIDRTELEIISHVTQYACYSQQFRSKVTWLLLNMPAHCTNCPTTAATRLSATAMPACESHALAGTGQCSTCGTP